MIGLSPKQRQSVAEATAPVNIWHGSVRSGKTMASILAFGAELADLAHRRADGEVLPGRVVIVGRTMDTIYRNVVSGLIELIGDGPGLVEYTPGANRATILDIEVDVIGASDARSEARIRGMTIRLAYVDEATLLPSLDYWLQLLNRQITLEDARTFATTNPDGPMHWFKTDVIDRADELGYRVWHFVLDDNPALSGKAKAEAHLRNVGLYHKRNILGLWVLAEGAIWDMFDEDRHVVATLPEMSMCTLAVDYGTAGVFAAHLLAVGADNRLYVAREYRWDAKENRRQLTDAEYARRLRAQLDTWADEGLHVARSPAYVHVDPSATSFITQLHRDGWQRVRGADNAVGDGIREVATLLGADRLRVHESCKGLRDEIPGYVWDPKAALKGEDRPVKANDHHCDALRYGVRGTRRWWRGWLGPSDAEAA